MPEYRIYYDGGKTYDGDPYLAPAWGVLAIVQKNRAHGRRLIVCFDYFVWQETEWMGCDHIGMIDYLQQSGPRKVIFGRMVDKEYFYKIAKLSNEDPDFPERTGWGEGETKI